MRPLLREQRRPAPVRLRIDQVQLPQGAPSRSHGGPCDPPHEGVAHAGRASQVCDCKLPPEAVTPSAQQASAFLQQAGGSGPWLHHTLERTVEGVRIPRSSRHRGRAGGEPTRTWERDAPKSDWRPVSGREARASKAESRLDTTFVQTSEGAAGLNQPMECDCERVKCSCLRKVTPRPEQPPAQPRPRHRIRPTPAPRVAV